MYSKTVTLSTSPIIPVCGITKKDIHVSVRSIILKVVGINSIEKTFHTEYIGKWFVVTKKACKKQVHRENKIIITGLALKINHSGYNNQPRTKTRANIHQILTLYNTF